MSKGDKRRREDVRAVWGNWDKIRWSSKPRKPIGESCDKPCGPSDWYKGGKCDRNGCYYEQPQPEGI
jgi:hypothetical protein